MGAPVARIKLICEQCAKGFFKIACEMTRGRGRFCSKACFNTARRTGPSITCAHCGNLFYRKPSEVTLRAFCSRSCYEADRNRGAKSYPKIGSRHKHRIIAEQKLGRPLRPGEIVHHVDENKRNPAADNLEIYENQAAHMREHMLGKPSRNKGKRRHREAQL